MEPSPIPTDAEAAEPMSVRALKDISFGSVSGRTTELDLQLMHMPTDSRNDIQSLRASFRPHEGPSSVSSTRQDRPFQRAHRLFSANMEQGRATGLVQGEHRFGEAVLRSVTHGRA